MDRSFLGRKSFFESSVEPDAAPEKVSDAKVESEAGVDNLLRDDAAPAQHNLSVIGKTLVFKGELSAEEDLLIQGKVEGTIRHNASNLTIGAHGNVTADIDARSVIVQGQVTGDIRGEVAIVVEPSARVEGNLLAPQIGLKEGASFKGTVDMDPQARERKSEKGGSSSQHDAGRDGKSRGNRPQGKSDQSSDGSSNTVAE